MRIALTYHPQPGAIRVLRAGPDQPLPDTVKVGDFQPHSGWVVAVVKTPVALTQAMQQCDQLQEQGRVYAQAHSAASYRYYVLFHFYIIDPKHATTVKEKVTLDLMGETETVRAVGYQRLPEREADMAAVWDALEAAGIIAAPTQIVFIPSGALLGQRMSETELVTIIDTQSPRYRDWQPVPTQVMANPVIEITAVTVG